MRETLARLNAEEPSASATARRSAIGVGIHTGLACVGNMGAESRFNYSAVGDAVNIAARIESSCKEVGFDILVTESTASLIEGLCAARGRGAGPEGKERSDQHFCGRWRRARRVVRRICRAAGCARAACTGPAGAAGKQPQDRQRGKSQSRRHNGRIAGILCKDIPQAEPLFPEPAVDEISYAEQS